MATAASFPAPDRRPGYAGATAGPTGADNAVAAMGPLATSRRGLTRALALVWLLDAGLQYQPYMFTKAFPNEVIKPAGTGSPAWISSPVTWSADLMAHHIIIWNALFATAQLVIALGLLYPRTVKLALAASIGWAVMVWWLGEGLGGALAGAASPLMGFPGAVILYAFIAVLVWPREAAAGEAATSDESVAASSPLRAAGSKLVWLVLWVLFVFETLRPANRASSALHDMIAGMADGEPAWIKSIDRWGAGLVDHGLATSIVLAVAFAAIAICVYVRPVTRPLLLLAIAVSLAMWVVAQDFGELATGDATDPNSGPLLVLLALCFWPIMPTAAPPRSGPPTSAPPT
jgi:hypothetical protein